MSKILTISIAAYNIQDYLVETLESLIRCETANEMDVIVINDGSRDDTSRIAHEYAEKAPSIIRVVDKENSGYGSTINTSIQRARGKYYRLLDGDDWVDPVELDKLIHFLEHSSVDLVITKYRMMYNSKSSLESLNWPYDSVMLPIDDRLDYSFSMHMLTFRTDAVRQCLIDHPITEYANYTDTEFILKCVSAVKTVALFDAEVYQYRMGREGQSVSLQSWFRNISTACNVSLVLANYYETGILPSSTMSPQIKEWALEQCVGSAANKCRLYMRMGLGRKEYEGMLCFLSELKQASSIVYNDTLVCFPAARRGKASYFAFLMNALPLRCKTIVRNIVKQ